MADGYGIGGYGGLEEPWGSVEYPLPSSLNRNALSTGYLGIIEATSGIIGEADNEIGGFRSTKLLNVANIADSSIDVESTLNWDSSGKLTIDGVVYYYTSTTYNTINGISYIQNGSSVSGIAKLHRIESEVIDLNKNYSYLDKLRRALLVDYAEGEDLRVIGRNIGVPYIPLFGADDQYREIIKAVAYSPRGTTYAIEAALDAILGIGTYEIYEDLVNHPCEIIIKVNDSYLTDDSPIGKSYLSGILYGALSGSSDTISGLSYYPTSISYVKLKGLSELFDFRDEIPSVTQYEYYEGGSTSTAFTYMGSLAEGSAVTNSSGLYTIFDLTSGTNDAYYEMLATQGARITEESTVTVGTTIQIPSTSALSSGLLEQISFSIGDGNRRVSVGLDSDYRLGLFDTEVGGFLGSTYTISVDTFYNIKVFKYKNEYVELYINGDLITRELYSSFITSYSDHHILFGLQGTPSANASFYIKQLGIDIRGNQDLWSSYFDAIGFTNAANPTRFGVTGTHSFSASDIGDYFEIKNSTALNSYGGNNNGKYIISSVVDSTHITLGPITKNGANIEDGSSGMVVFPNTENSLKYPDDLGKLIEITGSILGNNGIYYIESILQDDTLLDFSTLNTSMVEHTRTCILNDTSLINEVDLTYSILPNFVTDSNLSLIHSDSSNISGSTITLRDALWTNDLILEIGTTSVLSAQLLYDAEIVNTLVSTNPSAYEYYPFYLVDKEEIIKSFIDDLTIAGVIPKISNR